MSDLAKKCADKMSDEEYKSFCPVCGEFPNGQPSARNTANAIAAFIEAAQACRDYLDGFAELNEDANRYDAAIRDLAQSMEVE